MGRSASIQLRLERNHDACEVTQSSDWRFDSQTCIVWCLDAEHMACLGREVVSFKEQKVQLQAGRINGRSLATRSDEA